MTSSFVLAIWSLNHSMLFSFHWANNSRVYSTRGCRYPYSLLVRPLTVRFIAPRAHIPSLLPRCPCIHGRSRTTSAVFLAKRPASEGLYLRIFVAFVAYFLRATLTFAARSEEHTSELHSR